VFILILLKGPSALDPLLTMKEVMTLEEVAEYLQV